MKRNTVISIKDFKQPTLFDSDYAQYYYNCGRTNFYRKDYDEAVKHFEMAIELQPKNNEYIAALFVSSYYKRKHEKALEDYSITQSQYIQKLN